MKNWKSRTRKPWSKGSSKLFQTKVTFYFSRIRLFLCKWRLLKSCCKFCCLKKLKKCADYKFKRAKYYYVVTLSYHQTTTQQLFHNQLSCVLLLLWRQLFDEVWLLERELFYVIIYFKMLWVGWFSNFYITYFTIFQSFNSS